MPPAYLMEDEALAAELRRETRTERMEQRVKRTMKEAIEFAATISGTDTSEFVTRAAFEAALDKIRSTRSVGLTAADALRFCEALDKKQEPNPAMRQLMAEHDDYVTEE
jgi:uncharacterized protein (DUF1778 family)